MTTTPSPSPPPRAARRDGQRTRAAIRRAATELFVRNGYERTTVRAIAERAGCNPALISRYFGGKEKLFAVLSRPELPGRAVAAVLREAHVRHWGALLVLRQLRMGSGTGREELLDKLHMLLRSTDTPHGARLLSDMLTKEYLEEIAGPMSGADVALRAQLILAQLMGLTMVRDVIGLPALRRAKPRDVARYLGPALQHLLTPPERVPGEAPVA